MSLYDAFRQKWANPQKPVIVTPEKTWTWKELDLRVRQAANWLTVQGCRSGDIVALQMEKSVEYQALVLGALALGVTILPLNPAYTPVELRHILTDSGAKIAVLLTNDTPDTSVKTVNAGQMNALLDNCSDALEFESQDPNQIAFLCYTSGTTGVPKGALIRHRNVLHTIQSLHGAWRWSSLDTLVHALPMFHIHGLFVAQFGAYFAGATTIWIEQFDPNAVLNHLSLVPNGVFMGVPTHYHRLLKCDEKIDLSRARLFTSGSAPLPASVHEQFETRFGHRILERYGMTEIGIVLSNPYEGTRKAGTVGHPLPGIEARIRSADGSKVEQGGTGELHIRGPSVMSGYLRKPDATRAAIQSGWMHTGDLATIDSDGYICIVGRNTDMIISGGLNIYPREVESTLLKQEGVDTAAVVGIPDPDLGERVVAAITSACVAVDTEALRKQIRSELAPYKCPKEIKVVHQLPRNAMGKVQKHAIRQLWPLLGATDWNPQIQSALIELIRTTPTTPKPLAVFDFDNTCIAGDIGEAVLLALAKLRGVDYLAEYQERCENDGRLIGYQWCAEQCAGLSPAEIRVLAAKEFSRAREDGRIALRTGICDLIEVFSRSHWDVWIVTASAETIVQGVSSQVGIPPERVIGMKMPLCPETGQLLPIIEKPVTVYQGKLDAILQFLGRPPNFAAGDSDTDFEMIESAKFGLAIDRGQPKLRELAQSPHIWLQTNWTTRTLE